MGQIDSYLMSSWLTERPMADTNILAKHIDELCGKHQITILNRSSHGGRA